MKQRREEKKMIVLPLPLQSQRLFLLSLLLSSPVLSSPLVLFAFPSLTEGRVSPSRREKRRGGEEAAIPLCHTQLATRRTILSPTRDGANSAAAGEVGEKRGVKDHNEWRHSGLNRADHPMRYDAIQQQRQVAYIQHTAHMMCTSILHVVHVCWIRIDHRCVC